MRKNTSIASKYGLEAGHPLVEDLPVLEQLGCTPETIASMPGIPTVLAAKRMGVSLYSLRKAMREYGLRPSAKFSFRRGKMWDAWTDNDLKALEEVLKSGSGSPEVLQLEGGGRVVIYR